MTEYSEQVKAQALAALLAGQAAAHVSSLFGIPVGTLHSWRSRQKHGESLASLASEKRERVGLLLLDYLVTTLETLKVQQGVFADPDWLRKQTADDVAILHGVSVDKVVRLLEGLADNGE